MIIKDNGAEFETPEAGTYSAVCFRVIDIGTQTSTYEGKTITKRQVIIGWEIDEKMKDGKPFSVSHFYTASLNEKATLRQHLEAWRGQRFTDEELKGFDIKNLLGKPCMVTLIKNDKGKIKLQSVAKLAKGMMPPVQVNPTVNFSLDEFDESVFSSLTDGYKKLITQSPEYQALGTVDDGCVRDENGKVLF